MAGKIDRAAPFKKEGSNSRRSFARIPTIIDIPDLVETQKKSYEKFLQQEVNPVERLDKGLEEIFKSIFPIKDLNKTVTLEYIGYEIGIWECFCGEYKNLGGKGVVCDVCNKEVQKKIKHQVVECHNKGLTYADALKVMVRLISTEKNEETGQLSVRDVKEQKIFLGEIPLMTEKGTFLINGTERVIVSQMHRSPGVFFVLDKGKGNLSGKILYSARIIPYRGSWIDFEFDSKDILYVRIDRRRKMPVTILLKAMGVSMEEILSVCYKTEEVYFEDDKFSMEVKALLVGQRVNADILDPRTGDPIIKKGKKFTKNIFKRIKRLNSNEKIEINTEDLIGKIVGEDIVDLDTGEIVLEINTEITEESIKNIKDVKIERFKILRIDELNPDYSLRNTLLMDKIKDQDGALREIYKRLRPGDPPTIEIAKQLFNNLFFNSKRYDLSEVGRLKLNEKLGLEYPLDQRVLTSDDVVGVVKYIIGLKNGVGNTDDIDHLGNRRVRSVGEALGNQFRVGLVRMERAIMERMSMQDIEMLMPQDLINSKPVTAAVKEFFGSSQLSQFMDQTNPLSEITHKRRLSALGPGGLTRERAQFEVRDVHPTHYGRICPIETPEGPNIGLIASLSSYARVNDFGFIETPYRKVNNGRVSSEIEYLSAFKEDKYTIAQANAELDEENNFIKELISARFGGEFIMVPPDKIDYMDVSPKQLVSAAASLIPFLENDDANRALMGSNMQRQAVPLIQAESPIVGTGMEEVVARDSGVVILAKHSGVVVNVDSIRIVIRITGDTGGSDGSVVDIYTLKKYQRSNQNTCDNQKPIVSVGDYVKKGQVIADGPAVDNGELALGKNILVAFMPWGGYNFEDAIIISEKVVKRDIFTSIHIEEFEVEARDTKQGKEEFTRDIPNVGEEALSNLDESGIIRIGARVKPDEILVGKVTPKGETQLSPEEKLLKAIFGEKAGDVKDTSLRVPPGIEGCVIDVKVFSRKGVEKDSRSIAIEENETAKIQKDYEDEIKIIVEERNVKLKSLFLGKVAGKSVSSSKTGKRVISKDKKITEEMLDSLDNKELLQVVIDDAALQQEIDEVEEATQEQINQLKNSLNESLNKIKKGDELAPGVIKIVKVYIAMKRKLSVGDKMAGRHGNKGVVSIIVPEEDMPYLPDGRPVELILNPLGVPSRMNVGQILETYLGFAASALNVKVMSPVFDGAKEEDIRKIFDEAKIDGKGETILYDGKTGEPFEQEVVVGKIYLLKLHHLVDDKIHARSTGPYSLVTQQPLGGKAQFGGQRLGEMEVWALEGYGAAYTLQEMLTVKSDDVEGRKRMYEAIVKGENTLSPSLPESFNVLVKELQSLALDVELIETDD